MLPFSIYETEKRALFDTNRLLAVNGESVVAINAKDQTKVDKFMFRYPGKMTLEAFETSVRNEINAVMEYLGDVALSTTVNIKPADVLKHVRKLPLVVTQSQTLINLTENPELSLSTLLQAPHSPQLDRTARDLEKLTEGSKKLLTDYEYFPDIANNSGNLRRNISDGAVTLIDVMPLYARGNRLINDNPPNALSHSQNNAAKYESFVGSYGA